MNAKVSVKLPVGTNDRIVNKVESAIKSIDSSIEIEVELIKEGRTCFKYENSSVAGYVFFDNLKGSDLKLVLRTIGLLRYFEKAERKKLVIKERTR